MSIGDHIQFTSTGVRGLVVKFTQHGSLDFVHVLCGPDADGDLWWRDPRLPTHHHRETESSIL